MKTSLAFASLCSLALTPEACAAPQIGAILNAASYSLPALPNYGIAPGSIFVVFGNELGPATSVQASGSRFPTTLGGTSVRVPVNVIASPTRCFEYSCN